MKIGEFKIEMNERCKNCPYKDLYIDQKEITCSFGTVYDHSLHCEHENVCKYYVANYCGEGGDYE